MTVESSSSIVLRSDFREPRGPLSMLGRVRIIWATLGCFVLSFAISFIGCVVAIVSLFRARRWIREVLIRSMARMGLTLYGVKIREHHRERIPNRQCVLIANHTSSLDVAVIVALGLPNSRYFMSGFLKRIPPLAVIGWLLGMFWTVKQCYPERRTQIFQHADRTLRATGESVFLTPEGQEVWKFNKGAFHLATSLRAPIVPIYILIPNEVDPGPWDSGEFYAVRPGTVDVYFGEPIDTSQWLVEEVSLRRDQVRSFYVEWYSELHGGRRPPTDWKSAVQDAPTDWKSVVRMRATD